MIRRPDTTTLLTPTPGHYRPPVWLWQYLYPRPAGALCNCGAPRNGAPFCRECELAPLRECQRCHVRFGNPSRPGPITVPRSDSDDAICTVCELGDRYMNHLPLMIGALTTETLSGAHVYVRMRLKMFGRERVGWREDSYARELEAHRKRECAWIRASKSKGFRVEKPYPYLLRDVIPDFDPGDPYLRNGTHEESRQYIYSCHTHEQELREHYSTTPYCSADTYAMLVSDVADLFWADLTLISMLRQRKVSVREVAEIFLMIAKRILAEKLERGKFRQSRHAIKWQAA